MNDTVSSPARRNFFKRLAQPVEVPLPVSEHPRPPWSCDNRTFLSLCDRCEQCINACPQKVLRKSEEADDILQGLPVLMLDYGSCDFCGKCVEACTTGAISQDNGEQYQAVAVVNSHCSAGVGYGIPCQMCVESCEAGAITVPEVEGK